MRGRALKTTAESFGGVPDRIDSLLGPAQITEADDASAEVEWEAAALWESRKEHAWMEGREEPLSWRVRKRICGPRNARGYPEMAD
eukprot:807836-Alexandrium_andersonii.AAC.1